MVNKQELIKNEKFVLAAILFAMSTLLWGATFVLYKNPKLEPDIQERRTKDISSCSRFAKEIGYTVSSKSRTAVEFQNLEFTAPETIYQNIKQLALACNNMEPISFCMGVGEVCGVKDSPYGLKMKLSFVEPKSH